MKTRLGGRSNSKTSQNNFGKSDTRQNLAGQALQPTVEPISEALVNLATCVNHYAAQNVPNSSEKNKFVDAQNIYATYLDHCEKSRTKNRNNVKINRSN